MTEWRLMRSAPKDHGKPIWLFAATDCSEHVKPRLARWTLPNQCPPDQGEWWEEETDCLIVEPLGWFPVILPENEPARS